MSPGQGPPWRKTQVRFLEGGRGQQTPAAILWRGRWLAVRMDGGALLQGPEAGSPLERRFLVRDGQGQRYQIRGQDGAWQARALGPAA